MALRTQLEVAPAAWRPDRWVGMQFATWEDDGLGAERQDFCWQEDESRLHWIDWEESEGEIVDAYPDKNPGHVWWIWGRQLIRRVPETVPTETWTDYILDEEDEIVESVYQVGMTPPDWNLFNNFLWVSRLTEYDLAEDGIVDTVTLLMAHGHALLVGMHVQVSRGKPSMLDGWWSEQPTFLDTCDAIVIAVDGLSVQIEFKTRSWNNWNTFDVVDELRPLDPGSWLGDKTYLGDLCYLRYISRQYGTVIDKYEGGGVIQFPGGHHFQVGNDVMYDHSNWPRFTILGITETTITVEGTVPEIDETEEWLLAHGPWHPGTAPGRKALTHTKPAALDAEDEELYGTLDTGDMVPYKAFSGPSLTMRIDTSLCNGYTPSWDVEPLGETWATETEYAVNDCVISGGKYYVCVTAHTSDVFADESENWAEEAWLIHYGNTYVRANHSTTSILDVADKIISRVDWERPSAPDYVLTNNPLATDPSPWSDGHLRGATMFESYYHPAEKINLHMGVQQQGVYLPGPLPEAVTLTRMSGLPFQVYSANLLPCTRTTYDAIMVEYVGEIEHPHTGNSVFQFTVPDTMKMSSLLPLPGSSVYLRGGEYDEHGESLTNESVSNLRVAYKQPLTVHGVLVSCHTPECAFVECDCGAEEHTPECSFVECDCDNEAVIEILTTANITALEISKELALPSMCVRWTDATFRQPAAFLLYHRNGVTGNRNDKQVTCTGGEGYDYPAVGVMCGGTLSEGFLPLGEGHGFAENALMAILTTRTNNDEGEITLTEGHPFSEGVHGVILGFYHSPTELSWRTSSGVVAGNLMTISGGEGSNLPAEMSNIIITISRHSDAVLHKVGDPTFEDSGYFVVIGDSAYLSTAGLEHGEVYRLWEHEPPRFSIIPRCIPPHTWEFGGTLNLEWGYSGTEFEMPEELPEWWAVSYTGLQQPNQHLPSYNHIHFPYRRVSYVPGGTPLCDNVEAYAWKATATGQGTLDPEYPIDGEYVCGQYAVICDECYAIITEGLDEGKCPSCDEEITPIVVPRAEWSWGYRSVDEMSVAPVIVSLTLKQPWPFPKNPTVTSLDARWLPDYSSSWDWEVGDLGAERSSSWSTTVRELYRCLEAHQIESAFWKDLYEGKWTPETDVIRHYASAYLATYELKARGPEECDCGDPDDHTASCAVWKIPFQRFIVTSEGDFEGLTFEGETAERTGTDYYRRFYFYENYSGAGEVGDAGSMTVPEGAGKIYVGEENSVTMRRWDFNMLIQAEEDYYGPFDPWGCEEITIHDSVGGTEYEVGDCVHKDSGWWAGIWICMYVPPLTEPGSNRSEVRWYPGLNHMIAFINGVLSWKIGPNVDPQVLDPSQWISYEAVAAAPEWQPQTDYNFLDPVWVQGSRRRIYATCKTAHKSVNTFDWTNWQLTETHSTNEGTNPWAYWMRIHGSFAAETKSATWEWTSEDGNYTITAGELPDKDWPRNKPELLHVDPVTIYGGVMAVKTLLVAEGEFTVTLNATDTEP